MVFPVEAELERQDRSVAWLARKCGLSVSYVWRMLKGERPVTDKFRTGASVALGIPADELFPEAEHEAVAS